MRSGQSSGSGGIDWHAPIRPAAPVPYVRRNRFERHTSGAGLAVERPLVTERLHARLSAEDVIKIKQAIAHEPLLAASYVAAPDERVRLQMTLAYGIWLGQAGVVSKTGLPIPQPPEDVHMMAHGPLAAAGGLYEADMVACALASSGGEMNDVRHALDFGCSSGRVVRVLKAAYPDIAWQACDPNAPAIAWASQHLPGIEFFMSEDEPPLPLIDASLDLVYAISIWSHFAPDLGLAWFDEMRRILRPGGCLVCTTHGLTSVAYYAEHEQRTLEQSQEIADALFRRGCWYAPEFGEEGDWGVVNPEWGTSFISPEWLLAQLCPRWRVLEFAPGRNQDNQDVYVLQRV